MVIVSDDVRNVVNRIFLIGIAYKGRIPNMYGQIISAFEKLESSVANVNASSVNSAPFAWRKDNIGTPEYYRRNDRMQIGQEPIYNNARNWDDPNYNRKQSIGDSKTFNTNRGGQA